MELLLQNRYDNLGKTAYKQEELVPQPGAASRSGTECESQARRGPGIRVVVGVLGWQGRSGKSCAGLWNRHKTYIRLILRFHYTTPDHLNRSMKT